MSRPLHWPWSRSQCQGQRGGSSAWLFNYRIGLKAVEGQFDLIISNPPYIRANEKLHARGF